jgi:hypothetical protein
MYTSPSANPEFYWTFTVCGFVNEIAFKQKVKLLKAATGQCLPQFLEGKAHLDLDTSCFLFTRRYWGNTI